MLGKGWLLIITLIKRIKGEKHYSPLVDSIAFGSYNKKFTDGAETKGSWLTTDMETRKKYWADDFCTFKFTVSAMGDLIRLMKYSNRGAWFKNISSTLPILLVAGEEDPVGNYGKGVRFVDEKLKKSGKKSICILYSGARHEILNDFTYETVFADILSFIQGE